MASVSPKALPRRAVPSPTPTPAIKATGTARPLSAVSTPTPRRRPPSKLYPSTPTAVNSESKEALSASLKDETERKEQLLVQVQDREQQIQKLTEENTDLRSHLHTADTRLNELYAEQSRWEMEMSQRIEIAEKLRDQVRELEKEKRDLQRRYNEQTASFDAERQSFYDNEQHLKSRIQSLTQARKRAETLASANAPVLPAAELETPPPVTSEQPTSIKPPTSNSPDYNDPDNEPAEMTALKLELSTLSTSYASMQSTLVVLQSQLVDLKRVNQALQEENESYMILLREKTLSGRFDVMRQVGGTSSRGSDDDHDDDDDEQAPSADGRSLRSTGRSLLDRVDEEPESLAINTDLPDFYDQDAPSSARTPRTKGRRRTASTSTPRGETLADLPVAGPGLDLAAELGRAENKDILEGNVTTIDDQDDQKAKRSKTNRKSSNEDYTAQVEALKTEVKSLKDANKALSLYASKIIDRIIAQEGFEHVLAADYEKEPPTPSTPAPPPAHGPPKASPVKPRPQSVLISRTVSSPAPASAQLAPPTPKPSTKPHRRSLSFDWKSFSFTTSEPKKAEPTNLRPLTLKPGSSPVVTGGRKLDTEEDEEDRKERERLAATMKLMGIQQQPSIHTTASNRSSSPASMNNNRRFSLFGGSRSAAPDHSDTGSIQSRPSMESSRVLTSSDLTHEALAQAEAQNSLAALDARERNLTEEIAKGSNGGFTEISRRSVGRRGRRSNGGSGSGSTVFSAGMSGENE